MYMYTVGGNHWICTSSNKLGRVEIFDSMYSGGLDDDVMLQICNAYSSYGSQIEVHVPHIQQQKGYEDCGVFAIAFATEICFGNAMAVHVRFKQTKMRAHLKNCMKNKRLTSFPQYALKIRDARVPDVYQIELFCCCRMPDFFDTYMVECTECCEWFHFSCVGLSPGDPTDNWLCISCC